jgi:transposase-like protein
MKTLKSRRQYWREHVGAWRRSGLSQAAYCRQHGLIPRQLSYWVRRTKADGCDVGPDALTLVPARVQPAQPEALVLQNAQGWQLTLPATVSMEWLAALMRGLS